MGRKILESAKRKLEKLSGYLLVFFILMLFFFLIRNVIKINKAGLKIKEAKLKVERLRRENEGLEVRLEIVRREEFVEKQLRDQLGLVKEGEVVVILPDDDILRKLAPEHPEEEETLPDTNWKKWMKLFL